MSSPVEIRAPEEQTEGTRSQLLRWLKSVGEEVTQNEPLVEIETDKVTVEIAAPGSGVLREILKQEQEDISPGELLGRIEAASALPRAFPSAAEATVAKAGDIAGAPGAQTDSAPAGRGGQRPTPRAAEASPAQRPAAPSATGRAAASSAAAGMAAALAPANAALSPAVRRLIAAHGLEAAAIRGTGSGSRITVEDVLRHVADGADATAARPADPADQSAPRPAADESAHPMASRRIAHSAVRKRIAEHMVQSLLRTAPHVTTVFEANLAAVLRHREGHRAQFEQAGAPLTLTAYFLEAAAVATRAVPEANSRWTERDLEIFEVLNVGIATALATGLVVPVLRGVQSLALMDIARGLNDLVARARAARLTPADMRGGTFTISNHGVSGSLFAAPIVINQPQAAILGIGKLEKRAVVGTAPDGADRILIEPRCYVTLTIDHRAMDGDQANRWLAAFVRHLETYPA